MVDKIPQAYDLSYYWFNPATMTLEKTDDFFKPLDVLMDICDSVALKEPIEEFQERYRNGNGPRLSCPAVPGAVPHFFTPPMEFVQ